MLVTSAAKGGAAETEAAIAAARRAFDDGRWSRQSGKDRATLLLRVADLIDRDRERIARIETLEAGKPIAKPWARSRARRISGAMRLRWRGRCMATATTASGATCSAVVLKEPIGVASIITPWNFPFLIVSQKLPFALAAGCTAVVKPSEMTPSTTVILGELLVEAGLPAGVVNIVLGYGQPVGAMMTTDPRVDMVTFTGSTGVGKAIVAAAAPTLKKVVAGARRQEPAGDLPRRRSRQRGRCHRLRRLLQRRRMLQLRLADHRPRGHRRGGDGAGGGAVAEGRLRRAARSSDQGRRHRLARAPGKDRRLREGRRRGGRHGPARRAPLWRCRGSAANSTQPTVVAGVTPTWRSRGRRCSARCCRC